MISSRGFTAGSMRSLLGVLLLTLAGGTLWAAGPVDVYEFPTPELEARYRALIDEFRCPKCLIFKYH